MRLWERKVLTTLSDDDDIFMCLIRALKCSPDEVQLRLFGRVKHQMLHLNHDLVRGLYDDFVKTLNALGVAHPFPTHQDDPRQGGRYQIPSEGRAHGTTPGKMSREERLSVRSLSRKKQWDDNVQVSGFSVEQLDLLLATPESVIGKVRDEFLVVTEQQETRHLDALDDLRHEHAQEMDQVIAAVEEQYEAQFQRLEARMDEMAGQLKSITSAMRAPLSSASSTPKGQSTVN